MALLREPIDVTIADGEITIDPPLAPSLAIASKEKGVADTLGKINFSGSSARCKILLQRPLTEEIITVLPASEWGEGTGNINLPARRC